MGSCASATSFAPEDSSLLHHSLMSIASDEPARPFKGLCERGENPLSLDNANGPFYPQITLTGPFSESRSEDGVTGRRDDEFVSPRDASRLRTALRSVRLACPQSTLSADTIEPETPASVSRQSSENLLSPVTATQAVVMCRPLFASGSQESTEALHSSPAEATSASDVARDAGKVLLRLVVPMASMGFDDSGNVVGARGVVFGGASCPEIFPQPARGSSLSATSDVTADDPPHPTATFRRLVDFRSLEPAMSAASASENMVRHTASRKGSSLLDLYHHQHRGGVVQFVACETLPTERECVLYFELSSSASS